MLIIAAGFRFIRTLRNELEQYRKSTEFKLSISAAVADAVAKVVEACVQKAVIEAMAPVEERIFKQDEKINALKAVLNAVEAKSNENEQYFRRQNIRARLFESRLSANLGLNHSNPKLNFNRRLVPLFKARLALTSG